MSVPINYSLRSSGFFCDPHTHIGTATYCQNMRLKIPTSSCTFDDLDSMARVCGHATLSLRWVIGSVLTTIVLLLSSGSTAHQPGE
jgi:hypothetical protein